MNTMRHRLYYVQFICPIQTNRVTKTNESDKTCYNEQEDKTYTATGNENAPRSLRVPQFKTLGVFTACVVGCTT